ncbi:twin-arginine translocation signal domain-containing protein, partial [bacterium]|nr:twin-arginine translocation signal domain-containing protein [bacterium]
MSENRKTRRSFLKTSTSVSVAGLTTLHLVPNTVLGGPNRKAPSDQLRFGNIGLGGRGRGFIRPGTSIALCDVDEKRLANGAKRAGGNPTLYTDYRKLLEQKDLDAVFVTTPDHWHALMTIHACEAGKDVYVEKPACKTIEEGRAMVNAANRYARVVQVGSQGRSQEGAFYAHQYIKNGQIGHVDEVRCWHYCNPHGNFEPNSQPPEHLNYNKWIGPNRWVPYNKGKTHGRFRFVFDKGGGEIRDRGAHVMSCALWIMDSDFTGPSTIEAVGEPQFDGGYDVPDHLKIKYEFKDPDWTLIWAEPGESHEEGFEWVRKSYG